MSFLGALLLNNVGAQLLRCVVDEDCQSLLALVALRIDLDCDKTVVKVLDVCLWVDEAARIALLQLVNELLLLLSIRAFSKLELSPDYLLKALVVGNIHKLFDDFG